MTSAAEILRHGQLPAFLLVRSLRADYLEIHYDTLEIDGEVLGLFDSFAEAQAMVPAPTVPTDPQKLVLVKRRFGEIIDSDPRTGKQVRRLAKVFFDTDPSNKLSLAGNRPGDLDIFGERYTIVWVCPPDIDVVVERLLEELAGRLGGEPLSLETAFLRALEQAAASESGEEDSNDRRIDAYDLWDLWNRYIDRICWYDPKGQGHSRTGSHSGTPSGSGWPRCPTAPPMPTGSGWRSRVFSGA